MRAALYFHTLRHLRPIQIQHQLANRFLPRTRSFPSPRPQRMRAGLHALACCRPVGASVSEDLEFRFLNVSRASGAVLDWRAADMPKLWRYNLHYFDWLLDPQVTPELKERLLEDWIRNNPPGAPDAWEPYPVSLRAVNWIKYFLALDPAAVRPQWLTSLHAQMCWLESRLEYHLLANHLLKNAVALFCAGAFFDDERAQRWLQLGSQLLEEQIAEQFLADGGHYERSPMYHAICVVDALDVLNMAAQPALSAKISLSPALRGRVERALHFLSDVCLPDGEIALFNDSALGIAPPPSSILAYAERAIGWKRPETTGALRAIDKPACGYFGVRHGEDMLLIDCGEVGPDYQPGHAHCDTLSYELALDGSRVIVDSGVHDYEIGERRTLSRSTVGHNTVRIDGCEQSEIWGAFRVARRARPLDARSQAVAGRWVFEGAHDGYRRLRGSPLHRRRVEYDGRTFMIMDVVEGSGQHTVESRIRLHPDYKSVICGGYARVLRADGSSIARIEFTGATAEIEPAKYFPEFGRECPCDCIVLRCRGELPLRFGYRIIKEARR